MVSSHVYLLSPTGSPAKPALGPASFFLTVTEIIINVSTWHNRFNYWIFRICSLYQALWSCRRFVCKFAAWCLKEMTFLWPHHDHFCYFHWCLLRLLRTVKHARSGYQGPWFAEKMHKITPLFKCFCRILTSHAEFLSFFHRFVCYLKCKKIWECNKAVNFVLLPEKTFPKWWWSWSIIHGSPRWNSMCTTAANKIASCLPKTSHMQHGSPDSAKQLWH